MDLFAPAVSVLVFLLCWGIFYKVQTEWRTGFLSAAVVWGTLLTIILEVLNLFKAILLWPLLGAWSLCLILAILGWIKIIGSPKNLVRDFKIPDILPVEFFLLGSIVFIAGTVGIIAVIAPPNTFDSMTYHMARVMHWMQNESIDYYPAHILRQLYLNPWSEFAILDFQILTGTDRLANLVQWFSMIGSAIGVSLIAKELGTSRRGQIFSAVVSITIPMGIVQGSSTQNDYTVTFWLICFVVYWMLNLRAKVSHWKALALGASIGLALLTKGTAYLYVLPFVIWLGLSVLRTRKATNLLWLSVAALIALTINCGYYLRNYQVFSNPLGIDQEVMEGHYTLVYKLPNDIFSLPALMSNSIRNIAINLGTPFGSINTFLDNAIYLMHQVIGISPNDPRTTYAGVFHVPWISFTENSTGNFLDVVLIMIAAVLVISQRQHMRLYVVSLIVSFLTFSVYLKWQPWNSRLELPLFALWSPIIGITAARIKGKYIGNAVMLLIFVASLPWLFLNQFRPLIGSENIFNTSRTTQYFASQPSLENSYLKAIRSVNDLDCKQIGLYLDGDDWEYPFWILLKQNMGKEVQIESVNVENISAVKYGEFPEFTPCAVLAVNPLRVNNFQVNDTSFSIYQTMKSITVLTRK